MIIPDTISGVWNQQINKGASWPATTISMTRDGVVVVPASAALYFYVDGALALTLNAVVDGGGVMTIGALSPATTSAINWSYANSVFVVTEIDGTVTDLLAGNATVINRSD